MIEFYNAVRDLLPSTVTVYLFDALIPIEPGPEDYPYVVIHGTAPSEMSGSSLTAPSLCDLPDKVEVPLQFTYAGITPESVLVVMGLVRDALRRSHPSVSGYRTEMGRLSALQRVQVDREVEMAGRHPMFASDEAVLTAHKL